MGLQVNSVRKRVVGGSGFTLIELLATLVILAIIIAIAVPAVGNLVKKSGDSADKSSIALMERAGEMAELDGLKFDDAAPVNPDKPASITEKDVYMIPTLIEAGYLKLDDDSKFNLPENYVKKVNKSGKFIYMGRGSTTSPGGTPGDGSETGDGWVSKYRPFVTATFTAQFEATGNMRFAESRGGYVDETVRENYAELACAEWHDITESAPRDRHYQKHCMDHYETVFQKGWDIYNQKNGVMFNEYVPKPTIEELRPEIACYYGKMAGTALPDSMSASDVNAAFLAQLDVMGIEYNSNEMWDWIDANAEECYDLSPPYSPAAHDQERLKGLIDEITRQMDINNDYLPDYRLS